MILRHKKTGVTINTKDWEDAEPFQYPEVGSFSVEEVLVPESKDLLYVVDKDCNIVESYIDISGSIGCFNTIEKAEDFVVENKKKKYRVCLIVPPMIPPNFYAGLRQSTQLQF